MPSTGQRDDTRPGEGPRAEIIADALDREGIEVHIADVVVGRPNVIARVLGTGQRPPLVLPTHKNRGCGGTETHIIHSAKSVLDCASKRSLISLVPGNVQERSLESGPGHPITIDGLNTSAWGPRGVLEDLVAGGVTAINATIVIRDDFASTLDAISAWYEIFEENSDLVLPVRTVDDITEAHRSGRCGVIFGWQNATPIGNDLRRLKLFHELGVRIIQITYNERNLLGNGCYELHDEGLSKFGRAAVAEMNRTGILIDLSHVGDQTTLDAIELSELPVAITHANARSQDDHPRNKTDDAIRLLEEKGGVIGANGFPMFFPRGFEATLDDYLDRIEYLVQMVGPEHVALGSDLCQGQIWRLVRLDTVPPARSWFESAPGIGPFSSLPPVPAEHAASIPEPYVHLNGFASAAEFQNIAAGLEKRGYSRADIENIMGGNWLRLFSKVWRN